MDIRLYAVELARPLRADERERCSHALPYSLRERLAAASTASKRRQPSLRLRRCYCRALHDLRGWEDAAGAWPTASTASRTLPAHPDVSFQPEPLARRCVLRRLCTTRPLGVGYRASSPSERRRCALRRVLGAANGHWTSGSRWVQSTRAAASARGISAVAEQRDLLLPRCSEASAFASLAVVPKLCRLRLHLIPAQDAVKLILPHSRRCSNKRFRRGLFGTFYRLIVRSYSSTTIGS